MDDMRHDDVMTTRCDVAHSCRVYGGVGAQQKSSEADARAAFDDGAMVSSWSKMITTTTSMMTTTKMMATTAAKTMAKIMPPTATEMMTMTTHQRTSHPTGHASLSTCLCD
ncbi:unnamed protein product [Angiostrongylus costaricensis]|uniref:Uncharacterized protein n=1 Tax=Angiostrongylus costaricensis TaxID=334426 RepID=A0A0R3PW62_ANGCS|nr:unnamed protein product [Angiostrongylus costaricensis]